MNKEVYDKLNALRVKVLYRTLLCIGIGTVVSIMALNVDPFAGIFTAFLSFIITVLLSGSTDYVRQFKKTLLKELFNKNFENCKFSFAEGLKEEYVRKTKLVTMGDEYESDDLISGSYRGINFTRSDIHIYDEYHDKNGTSTITLFRGQWMIFDLPKEFHSVTKVLQHGFFKAINPGESWFSDEKMECIETESAKFNDHFTIYTTNPHDAFYLLTPQVMEQMLKVERKYEDVRFGFINGKLHVLIESDENNFEPSILTPVDGTTVHELQKQIDLIKDIADSLHLEGDDTDAILDIDDTDWSSRSTDMEKTATADRS